MITWIQRYFQHHFKFIFAILLAGTIISFIFITNTSGGFGSSDSRTVVDRPFFGYNLALERDQERLMGDAGLSANLRVGPFGGLDASQIQNYAFQRAATLHLADKWHIPAATAAEIEAQIKTLRMFAGQDGQFDAKAYQTFRDNLKTNPRGLTEADIARVVSDDVRAEKVQNLLAGPGYVLPADVKTQLARADTTWTLATASTNYNEFKPEIKPADTDLTAFFEQAGSRYDVPPKVVVSYLDFPVTGYLAKVDVTEADVRAFYDANPARFPKPADAAAPAVPNVTPAADANADFAAVRAQVETALRLERARKLAATAASDFSVALFEKKAGTGAARDKFLADRGVALKPVAPFTRDEPPAEFGRSPEVAAEAFRLNEGRPVSDAVATPTGAVILFWQETLPSRKPLFSEVRDKVAADYVENEKRKRFVDLGRTAKTEIEARLKAGDTFEKAVAAAGTKTGLAFAAKSVAPFTPRNRPQDLDYTVLGALERLEQGKVSDMSVNADAGVFVYAVEKKAPDLSEANPAFVETRNQIAGYSSRLGASAYLAELVEAEMKKSEPTPKSE